MSNPQHTRLAEAFVARRILEDIVNAWEGADWCAEAVEFLRQTKQAPKGQNEQAWEDLRADGGLPESQAPSAPELLAALKKAKQFIYYARYELPPGKAVIGDQFPKQEDADNVTTIIDAAIAKAEGK